MNTGSWETNVVVGKLPQKVATAFGELNDMLGVEYVPIAYLGKQVVNGTNHAVLAKQTVLTGRDTTNIVVLVFNEKPNEEKVPLVAVEHVLESGGELGGIQIGVKTDIPAEVNEIFASAFDGYVGAKVTPFALLGTQMTKGTTYFFAAELTTVTKDPEKKAVMVVVNQMEKQVGFVDMLTTKNSVTNFGYAFTW